MPSKQAPTVLVVDDDPRECSALSAMISSFGYTTETATDGEDALAKLDVQPVSAIITDLVMPRMNGFEACKMMRQQPSTRDIPIVLVTTRGEETYMEAGFESGCNDYITKPVNGEELVALLQSYLGE